MNPRILKKLSKRSDSFVEKLRPRLKRFELEKGDSMESSARVDRKHFERFGGKPNQYGWFQPLHNTIGYGEMSGYYEPEWTDNDAYSVLKECVQDHFTDWEKWDEESYLEPSLKIKTPRDVFRNVDALFGT